MTDNFKNYIALMENYFKDIENGKSGEETLKKVLVILNGTIFKEEVVTKAEISDDTSDSNKNKMVSFLYQYIVKVCNKDKICVMKIIDYLKNLPNESIVKLAKLIKDSNQDSKDTSIENYISTAKRLVQNNGPEKIGKDYIIDGIQLETSGWDKDYFTITLRYVERMVPGLSREWSDWADNTSKTLPVTSVASGTVNKDYDVFFIYLLRLLKYEFPWLISDKADSNIEKTYKRILQKKTESIKTRSKQTEKGVEIIEDYYKIYMAMIKALTS